MNKKIKITLVIIIPLLMGALLLYFLLPKKPGVLVINTEQFGINYTINNQPIRELVSSKTNLDNPPIKVQLQPGEYTLVAEKEDYKTVEEEFTIKKEKETKINIELEYLFKSTN